LSKWSQKGNNRVQFSTAWLNRLAQSADATITYTTAAMEVVSTAEVMNNFFVFDKQCALIG
jgi:hypothetical protein